MKNKLVVVISSCLISFLAWKLTRLTSSASWQFMIAFIGGIIDTLILLELQERL